MANRLGAAVDVLGGGARQAGDGGVFHPAGDFRHGFEIALRGDGEAGLDDIDAQGVQNVGDFQLFLKTHRGAGALLAIAQCGVEDIHAIGSGGVLRFGHGFNPGIFFAPEQVYGAGNRLRRKPLSAQAKPGRPSGGYKEKLSSARANGRWALGPAFIVGV